MFTHVSTHGSLPAPVAKKIARQLISAVEGIHRAGYYHGDLKLDNILIIDNSLIKLSDFGLSGVDTDSC